VRSLFWELKVSMPLLEALFNDVSDSQVKPFQCSNPFGTLKPGQCASPFTTFVRDIHTSVAATMPLDMSEVDVIAMTIAVDHQISTKHTDLSTKEHKNRQILSTTVLWIRHLC
jgi:hypothetical protein